MTKVLLDEEGRIQLPEDVRDQYGEEYRIVQRPQYVALIPIDEDPLEGVHEAVGDAFEGVSSEELSNQAISTAKADIESGIADQDSEE
ncbi:AbrB/MazE/SpoVT family DNA-binding domain-containing protein [Natronomonas sp. CBA1123]|uniref:AbrB/MazE/SpoVT family DNA-binding domain-containing protein n=1 Tax=Natronomonas sp. CBA1123 TaxID=2668070 RepID=UPI0012E9E354|nr:AbrB/MazE/SpoVT family DNA-binding domain-containing protein [Natronomonas sp. CBA1123]MUV85105.1 AbrB/MazE/SpoVT family DNA-binding domain-containing protein [Natronomonas sp. CBA1123]